MLGQRYPLPEVYDSSMLAAYKACPQLFFKTYIAEWKSKAPKIHLHAGGAYAWGLEVARRKFFEENWDAESAVAMGMWECLRKYGDIVIDEDAAKQAIDMAGAVQYYFDNYPLNKDAGYPIILPGGKRAIEFSFVHPMRIKHSITGQEILYCGRSDQIVNYCAGDYIEDDKTTGQMGPKWSRQWPLRSQYAGYTWGAHESGINVKGVLTRGLCILMSEYKTQESIDNFSDWEIQRWYAETMEWINEIQVCWQTGRWKYNLDSSCTSYGGCGFATVCKQNPEQPWLETYFERRHWSPLTREETKL